MKKLLFLLLCAVFMINLNTPVYAEQQQSTVIFFGDSCTAGFVSDSGSPVLKKECSYAAVFGQNTGEKVYNYAVGGATMSNVPRNDNLSGNGLTFSQQIDNAAKDNILSTADYIFVNFGMNDHMVTNTELQSDMGDGYDDNYYLDSFIMGCNEIKQYTDAQIIVILPHYTTREHAGLSTQYNALGYSLDIYRETLADYCNDSNIDIVDFRKCGINKDNYILYHNGDILHLTAAGYQLQGEYLANIWKTGYKKSQMYMKLQDNQWICYEYDGQKTDKTGIVWASGNSWYVVDGVLQKGYYGFVKEDTDYIYVCDGKATKNFTGLVETQAPDDDKVLWRAVINGRLAADYNGIVPNAGTNWYVENGVLNTDFTGEWKIGIGINYIVGGKLDSDFIGMRRNPVTDQFCYVYKGVVRTDYTGLVKNLDTSWYVEKGYLNNTVNTIELNGRTAEVLFGKFIRFL